MLLLYKCVKFDLNIIYWCNDVLNESITNGAVQHSDVCTFVSICDNENILYASVNFIVTNFISAAAAVKLWNCTNPFSTQCM